MALFAFHLRVLARQRVARLAVIKFPNRYGLPVFVVVAL